MRFYGRKKELEILSLLESSSPSFVVITGRRRIGKTELIKQFCKERDHLYFFIDSNKSSTLLIEEFRNEMERVLDIPKYARFERPEEFIEFLVRTEKELVISFDEFQRFQKMDPSFIASFQKIWDLHGQGSRSMIIVSGSSIGMLRRIFMDSGSPLFKRADNIITLDAFSIKDCFRIMKDLGVTRSEDMFNIYCLFGGIIFYYRMMEKYHALTFKTVLSKLILDDLAPLNNEVKDILIEEFGSDHVTYHEILSAMALGKASKKEIGDLTHIETTSLSPYLYDLNDILGIIENKVPVTDDPARSKKTRYFIKDNFFRFHYLFLFRNMSDYRIGNYDRLMDLILERWNTHRGRIYERVALDFCRNELKMEYPKIGSYWDRKGNELDIVCLDRKNEVTLVFEVKSRKLTMGQALKEIEMTKEKVKRIFGHETDMGIISLKLVNKEEIRKQGYHAYDLDDMV